MANLGIGGLTGKQLRELQDLVRLQVVAWHQLGHQVPEEAMLASASVQTI